jgi:hypothetical protein
MNSLQFRVELFAPFVATVGKEFSLVISFRSLTSTVEKLSLTLYLQENYLLEGSTSIMFEVSAVISSYSCYL